MLHDLLAAIGIVILLIAASSHLWLIAIAATAAIAIIVFDLLGTAHRQPRTITSRPIWAE